MIFRLLHTLELIRAQKGTKHSKMVEENVLLVDTNDDGILIFCDVINSFSYSHQNVFAFVKFFFVESGAYQNPADGETF